MGQKDDERGAPATIGWGCLTVAILLVGAAIMLAVIFLWDVNARH